MAEAAQPGVVVNDAGIPVKLITTRDTQLYKRPDRTSPSSPARIFRYWYVLPPDPSASSHRLSKLDSVTQNGFYRVASGENERGFQGWMAAEDVIRWSHRQALRPAPRGGRELVSFYASPSAALRALETGDTSAATHSEPADDNRLILMPILEAEEKSIDGGKVQLYRVAFVAAEPGSSSSTRTGSGTSRANVLAKTTLDLVFVIDTTASMTDPIRQVASSITRVARELSDRPKLKERVRFGLVGFRDSVGGVNPGALGYVAQTFCDLQEGANHRVFLQRLAALKVTKESSEDFPEDVLAGLNLAMDVERLGWNPFAWRQIVVVGDSSIKNPEHPDRDSRKNVGGATLESVRHRAQKDPVGGIPAVDSFVISAVRIKNPLYADDHAVGDRQFQRLISGRRYDGKMITAAGGEEPEDFSRELTASLLKGIDAFEKLVTSSAAAVPASARGGLSAADFPYPMLDLLRRLPDEKKAAGPSFATRYCTDVDAEGNRILLPHLLVRKGRLQSFVAFLDLIQGLLEEAGEPGSRDLGPILTQLQMMSVTLNIDEPITADLRLGQLLSGLLGFPVQTRVLSLTVGELAAMSAGRFQEWVRSVSLSRSTLKRLIENPNLWFKLHPSAGERDQHAFVALSDLP
ncbi:MAG: VWA domain-containing protein [bacterium]|nr:VWA domain-containing protein [bacterium]